MNPLAKSTTLYIGHELYVLDETSVKNSFV